MSNYQNSVANNRWKVTSSNGVEQSYCLTITEFSDFIAICFEFFQIQFFF